MATKKQKYESVARIVTIAATSRASVKIRDNYFTVEYHEERMLPESGYDIERERELLWETVNSECDAQIEDIEKIMK